jgi:hypothetical protein
MWGVTAPYLRRVDRVEMCQFAKLRQGNTYRGSIPLLSAIYASIVQWIGHSPSKRRIGVRIPIEVLFIINALLVQWIEHLTTDQEIGVRISYGVLIIG